MQLTDACCKDAFWDQAEFKVLPCINECSCMIMNALMCRYPGFPSVFFSLLPVVYLQGQVRFERLLHLFLRV